MDKKEVVEKETAQEQQEQQQQSTGGWNDWSKASFGGDQAQKDKFMRLLGANKNKNKATSAADDKPKKKGGLYGSLKSAIDEDEGAKIANDLEKQFQSGLQFRKQMFSGRRGGLGS